MFKSVFKSGIRATYDVLNNATFVSEPWHVYPAKHNTNGKLASVFIFDKSKFEATVQRLCSSMSNTKNPRVIISECYELLKYEVSQLTKLKHPQILTIYEVLEETKLKILFVSEPVVNTLLTTSFDDTIQMDELSKQKGLLELCRGIQFLHNYCSVIHLNLQPSSIFINQQGDWKLSGFKFSQNLNELSPGDRENFYFMNNSSIVPFANYNLNFMPPELLIDTNLTLDTSNDIWGLGCLIFYIYNNGEYLINCFDANNANDFKSEFKKFEMKFYNHRISDLKYVLKSIPEKLYPIYQSILARHPHDRLSIDQLIDSDFFSGSIIKAMWFIDEFSTKSLDEKLIFSKGLLKSSNTNSPSLLQQFPQNFKTSKLLPVLIDSLTGELNVASNKSDTSDSSRIELVSYVLKIILAIGSNVSQLTFQDRIYESILKPESKSRKKDKNNNGFEKLINFSVVIRLTLIENLEILLEKLNDKQAAELIKLSVSLILTLPSNEAHFKQEQIQLQDLFLNKMNLFASILEFPYIKNTFFPLITQVFKTTTILSTKIATIKVFEDFVDQKIIDKIIVKDQLLPIFQNLKSRDKRIVSKVLNFFNKLSKDDNIQLDLETTVELILPICMKLVFGCNDCTQGEFKTYMKSIHEIQTVLINKKLPTLPTKIEKPVNNDQASSKNFESLISTQKFNDGNMENLLSTPKSSIMTPSNKKNQLSPQTRSSTTSRETMQPMRPTVQKNVLQPSKPTTPLSQSTTSTNKTGPLNLKQDQQKTAPQLSFGATGPNSTKRLLNTLESSWSNKINEQNEFLDFQSAPSTPSALNSNVSTPPGFNGSVLTPRERSNNNTYNTNYTTNSSKNTSNDESLLDLI